MLTTPERIIFALVVLLSLYLTARAVNRIIRIIQRGHGQPDWNILQHRLLSVPARIFTFQPLFRYRFLPSMFHALVGWGFLYYVIVNFGDLLQAYISKYQFLRHRNDCQPVSSWCRYPEYCRGGWDYRIDRPALYHQDAYPYCPPGCIAAPQSSFWHIA